MRLVSVSVMARHQRGVGQPDECAQGVVDLAATADGGRVHFHAQLQRYRCAFDLGVNELCGLGWVASY